MSTCYSVLCLYLKRAAYVITMHKELSLLTYCHFWKWIILTYSQCSYLCLQMHKKC